MINIMMTKMVATIMMLIQKRPPRHETGEGGDDTFEKDGGDYVDSVAATTLAGGGRRWRGRPERDLEGVGAREVGQQACSGGWL